MEMLTCVVCAHPCHCKGVGTYVNTNQCMEVDCNCITCIHAVGVMEETMAKKIVKWVWNIIKWPFKKAHEWLTNSLPK